MIENEKFWCFLYYYFLLHSLLFCCPFFFFSIFFSFHFRSFVCALYTVCITTKVDLVFGFFVRDKLIFATL